MKEIILKDKVITVTQDTLEIDRLSGKWFQSFFELVFIRAFLGIFIFLSIIMYAMSLNYFNQGILYHTHYLSFIVGGLLILVMRTIRFYKSKTISRNKIRHIDINRVNQLRITYSDRKKDLEQLVNLPKNMAKREKAINQLLEVLPINNSIPELPNNSEEKLHRNNLYIGIASTAVYSAAYCLFLNTYSSNFILIFNSIMLLSSMAAIVYSANSLSR